MDPHKIGCSKIRSLEKGFLKKDEHSISVVFGILLICRIQLVWRILSGWTIKANFISRKSNNYLGKARLNHMILLRAKQAGERMIFPFKEMMFVHNRFPVLSSATMNLLASKHFTRSESKSSELSSLEDMPFAYDFYQISRKFFQSSSTFLCFLHFLVPSYFLRGSRVGDLCFLLAASGSIGCGLLYDLLRPYISFFFVLVSRLHSIQCFSCVVQFSYFSPKLFFLPLLYKLFHRHSSYNY